MLEKECWKFRKGDLVNHLDYGTGIVCSRSMISVHEMDRPVRIVDKEKYTVLFSRAEKKIPAYGEELSLIILKED